MKIGLEKEFFLLDAMGQPVSLADDGLRTLPYDGCGWLVEARGKPFSDPVDAVFSLKADVFRIEQQLTRINSKRQLPFTLSDTPVMKVPRTVKLQSARVFQKDLLKYQNLFGYESHRNTMQEGIAGVHVSFTDERSYSGNRCVTCGHYSAYSYNVAFDWPQLFLKLDSAFAEEIKIAKRRPGFYEIKHDGRVEYRSLPANVDLNKLTHVLQSIVGSSFCDDEEEGSYSGGSV